MDAKAAIFISTIIHVLEQTSSVCPTIGILDRKNSNTQNIVISKYTYISNYLWNNQINNQNYHYSL